MGSEDIVPPLMVKHRFHPCLAVIDLAEAPPASLARAANRSRLSVHTHEPLLSIAFDHSTLSFGSGLKDSNRDHLPAKHTTCQTFFVSDVHYKFRGGAEFDRRFSRLRNEIYVSTC